MTGKWLGLGLAAIFIVVGWAIWPEARAWLVVRKVAEPTSSRGYGRAIVNFSDVSVTVSIPLTAELQAKGLGGRTGLGDREGMLWVYDQPQVPAFWMHGMLIPLDFVWIANQSIVDLTPNVPAAEPEQASLPTYKPAVPVDAVLEVKAGFIATNELVLGEAVTIDRR